MVIFSLLSKYSFFYRYIFPGVMVPPVLADINKDGTVDIIMAMFNATVVAFNGETFRIIWQYSFPSSETYRYKQ